MLNILLLLFVKRKLSATLMNGHSCGFLRTNFRILTDIYSHHKEGIHSASISTVLPDCSLFLMQTLEMLEKKEKVLLKKAAAEIEKAKEFTRAKNKRGVFVATFRVSICHAVSP